VQERLSQVRKVVVLLASTVLAACGNSGIKAPVGHFSSNHSPHQSGYHVVGEGETLYAIAWHHGLDYRKLAAWNDIRAPYTIFPGQRLRLVARTGGHHRAQPRKAPQRAPSAPRSKESRTESGPTIPRVSGHRTTEPPGDDVLRWQWPAAGRVVNSFDDAEQKGIDIGGRLGQSICAAAHGHVVYSGGGLRGYGKLIIIKHNSRFISAYAHNNNALVVEGDYVVGGQRIAEMGRTRSGQAMLHFEIRRDGRPVNPMRYLPRVGLKEKSHVETARDGWRWCRA
jgi:lipoprotein NlpD